MTHVIRLHSAWDTTSHGDRTHQARKFGRPRTRDVTERVWLVCHWVPGTAEVYLNGHCVGVKGEAGPFSADVTDLLHSRNEVLFCVASPDPLGEVAIEIRVG